MYKEREATSPAGDAPREIMHAAVRLYILFLGVYELLGIAKLISSISSQNPVCPAKSLGNTVNNPSEKRVWTFVLSMLAISRFVAVAWPSSPAALANLAIIHVAEAIFIVCEKLCFYSKGPAPAVAFVVANGVGFGVLAVLRV